MGFLWFPLYARGGRRREVKSVLEKSFVHNLRLKALGTQRDRSGGTRSFLRWKTIEKGWVCVCCALLAWFGMVWYGMVSYAEFVSLHKDI
ncbi:hypothetical protein K445DRAFT_155872 [Daldinia sp. EC12]|nr:hypothetical protein K445DRAFT_155872 [Daldinia sp. EC12]